MTHFRLEKSTAANHSSVTRFYVFNAVGDIIGSINVPPEDEADFLAHWRGSAPQAKAQAALTPVGGKQHPNPMVAAMLAAAPRNRFSKQAVLRGCA